MNDDGFTPCLCGAIILSLAATLIASLCSSEGKGFFELPACYATLVLSVIVGVMFLCAGVKLMVRSELHNVTNEQSQEPSE